ncbi:hypothetical protein Leryth_006159 [Lithospermum erythrorhizon]|nr:hypothetical protein Leryth_006159 [Lithospermum erythrorhizon]
MKRSSLVKHLKNEMKFEEMWSENIQKVYVGSCDITMKSLFVRWFYPYHYAPFASDLKDLEQLNICFELGSPFKPFNQLLGVFPAASSHALPEHYRKLMTDPNSPIIDFYPLDFEVDMNGKRFSWQGVAKLPFIDEDRLLSEVAKLEHTLTEEEARRNSIMCDMLFIAQSHPLSPYIFSLDDRCKQLTEKDRSEIKEKIHPGASGGMNGYLCLCAGDPCPPIFRSPVQGLEDVMDNQVVCAIYMLPDAHEHIARPPPGVTFPKKIVTLGDMQPDPVLWHEDTGRRPSENGRHNQYPSGAVSGRQLGDAAHRLVANSLQMRTDRDGYVDQKYNRPPSYATNTRPGYQSYSNNRYNVHGNLALHPSSSYPAHQPHHRYPASASGHDQHSHNYGHTPTLPVVHEPYNRSHHQYGRHGYNHPGPQHNGGRNYPLVPPQHVGQPPIIPAAHHYQHTAYSGYASNPQNPAVSYNPRTGGWVPQVSPGAGRGHNPLRQSGNQYAALDRRSSRRPPPS